MTEKLQRVLKEHLAALDRDASDFPLWEKCYQALMVVYIPPEVDDYMTEWDQEMDESCNLLWSMSNYWRKAGGDLDTSNAPVVALNFIKAFYYDLRNLHLIDRVENEYSDYIESLRGKDFYTVAAAAHEIDLKQQIVSFLSTDDESRMLDIEDIDLLLTFEHPLEKLYEACEDQEAMREAIEYSLDRVVEKQKLYMQAEAAADTEDEDIRLYRARYLSGRVEVPFPAISQMAEQLISRANQEHAAMSMWVELPQDRADRLHEAITFFREQGYTPVETAVMLTYDRPLAEVLERMEQGSLPAEFAFHCAVADRQAEMQQYIDRLDSLPEPLQASVREYQERLTAVEIFCTPAPQGRQDEEEESAER